MKNIRIGQKEIIHFIGIGGIGMSGLAQVMRTMGFKIQGVIKQKQKHYQLFKSRNKSIYRSFQKT